jgi:tetratricopeptide (TPR) repeat protein
MSRSRNECGRLAPGDRRLAYAALGLCALVVVVYLPALRDGFVSWDDYKFVVENEALTSAGGLRRIWSTIEMPAGFPNYPLLFTTYRLEHQLWGLDAAGYHATSIALHAINTVLVLALMRALGTTAWVAGVTAALFAVHPMQVESVAWVTERKNVLSAVFYLSAFLLYLRHRTSGQWRWYALCLAAFLCALLSKTATAVLPASLLLIDWVRDRRWSGGALLRVAPMLLLGGVAAVVTGMVESSGVATHVPMFERPLLAAAALWFYVLKLAVPFPLLPIYPLWQVSAASLAWWLPMFGVIAAGLALLRWPPPWRALWGIGHFACTLLPIIGLIPFGYTQFSFVADRFVYLGCLGLFLALAVAADQLRRPPLGRVVSALIAALVLVLAGLTWRQVKIWKDSETLWTYAVARNPKAWAARTNLAMALMDSGRLEEAASQLRAALQERPDYPKGHTNLAMVLHRQGQFEAAVQHARQAIALAPDFADGHSNLALALGAQGNLAGAEAEYRQAVRLFPGKAELHYNLGNALLGQGRPAEAIPEFERALELKPELMLAHTNLASALVAVGRASEAVVHMQQVVRAGPDDADAHYNLGTVLLRAGRVDEAVAQLQQALKLRPDHPRARDKLAAALIQQRGGNQ